MDEPARPRPRRRWPLVAFLALAFVFAWPMQVNGYNQNAHYALVRALADGVPYIDKSRGEIGEVSTGDTGEYRGHVYSAKGPGLAFATLPVFWVVDAVGMRTTGDPTRVIWTLHLWSLVLAALAIVLLVRRLGDRLAPGYGLAAAVTVGLATLVLPFATLFFAHVPAAALALGAFAVLAEERLGGPQLALVAIGGALAGLAVTTDYPLARAGALLGLYALRPERLVARAAAYTGGVFAGLLPLLAFNLWAFGNPFHIAYEDYYAGPGGGQVGGAFGFGAPGLDEAHALLVSSMGILVLTPVVAAGVAGAVLLLRSHRAEALAILGIAAVYLVWNSSLTSNSPFGGLGPPRYLIALVPFVGVALAAAYRAFPLTTLALALVSAFQMVVMTATGPLAAYDGDWLGRVRRHDFVQTGASVLELTGWYTIAPFFLAALVAAAAALLASSRPEVARAELPLAVAAVVAWALLALAAENPNGAPPGTAYVAAAAAALLAFCALVAWRSGRGPWVAGIPRSQRA
jgi:hypothetical protein